MRVVVMAVVLCLGSPVAQQAAPEMPEKVIAEHLAGTVYLLKGGDANIVASVGRDGVFLVDAESPALVEKARAALAPVTDQPIRWVVNTHFHPDHTLGNEALPQATTIAQENTRKRSAMDGKILGRAYPALKPAGLQDITYQDRLTLYLNGEEIRLIHLPGAHTDGDTMVWFANANVLHVGDTWEGKDFPFVDLDNGGTVRGITAAARTILEAAGDKGRIVPGHGAPGSAEDVRKHLAMLEEASGLIAAALRAGKTEDQVLTDDPLQGFAAWGKGFIRVKLFTRILYRDLQRAAAAR